MIFKSTNILYLITLIMIAERYKLWSSSLWSLLHSPFSSILGPNIRLRILFSNTLSLDSSLNVRDHLSQPYSTTGNIIVLYILIFKFFERSLEDKCVKLGLYTVWKNVGSMLSCKLRLGPSKNTIRWLFINFCFNSPFCGNITKLGTHFASWPFPSSTYTLMIKDYSSVLP